MSAMPESSQDRVEIALWGYTQVGKTTALATYVWGSRRPLWTDGQYGLNSPIAELEKIWQTLLENRPPLATMRSEEYLLWHRELQRPFCFRDMRGGAAVATQQAEDIPMTQLMQRADAVIAFIPWPNSDGAVMQLQALNRALFFIQDRPLAVAITKVEMHLRPAELAAFTLGDTVAEARRHNLPTPFIEILERVPPGACFPISVYGYRDDGYPAHYHDEYGKLVPWGVRPVNVSLPFDYVIERLK